MDENYEIWLNDQPVGRIQILRQGLYAKCFCACKADRNRIYRIIGCWEDGWENLGIPIPEGESLVLRKSLPIKRLMQKDLSFRMIPYDTEIEDYLRKADNEEPTSNISKPQEEEISPEWEARPNSGEKEYEVGNTQEDIGTCIPIDPKIPFERLDCLEEARFAVVEGKPMAVFREAGDQSSSESPMGQWSEPSTSE